MSFRGVFDEESLMTASFTGILRSADSAQNDMFIKYRMSFRGVFDEESLITASFTGILRSEDSAQNDMKKR